MRILVIEGCNYVDYPTGGHLAFVRNMLKAFPESELILVGITTDPSLPVGKWFKRTIDGKEYDYFSVHYREKRSNRSLIPARFSSYLFFRFYRKKYLNCNYDFVFFQPPEILLSLPTSILSKSCMCIPGVENPLHISRYKWARHFAWLYDAWFYRKAKHIRNILAAASMTAIQEFISIGKNVIPLERIHQFPTRFDRDYYHVIEQKDCRNRLGIPFNIPVFITVGRLAEFKGWKLMLDAFRVVYEKNSSARFYFIGDGEDEEKIKEYISNNGLQENCFPVGRKLPQEIGIYLNAASVFVMGSMIEGWSTTLVEACACGIPCVVTNFSSADDMIKNSINGYVMEERDPARFAELMDLATHLPREKVIQFNQQYSSLSVQELRSSLIKYFE